MKKTLQLAGLDCANCAAELEREISKIDGVKSASVAFVNQRLTVEYENQAVYDKIIYAVTHFEEVQIIENGVAVYATKRKKWLIILVSAALFLLAVLLEKTISNKLTTVLCPVLYATAYLTVGYPVLLATVKNIVKGKLFDENFLMTVASIGAVCIGETSEAVLVMLLYQIGETLQELAVSSSRRSIEDLLALKTEWANLIRKDGEVEKIEPERLAIGDKVLVKAGERIPVDGQLSGKVALLDAKALTGEAKLKVVTDGGELLAGCINAGAAFEMLVLRPYTDSAVCKILDTVENASSKKAMPEKFITKFARVYTPVVCLCALALAILGPLVCGLLATGKISFVNTERFVRSALTFLVISCPCALVVSVPLTYFSGIGACARRGVLVKGATHLDEVAQVKIAAFDKTGTLTEGNFKYRDLFAVATTEEDLLALAAAVERQSSHPIARAFDGEQTPYTATAVEEISGRGLKAIIDGETVLVGSLALLKENGVTAEVRKSTNTLAYVARKGVYLGVIEIGDKLKATAKETMEELKSLGFVRIAMLTGDSAARAQSVAEELSIDETYSELLPDEKLCRAEELKRDGKLLYLGDGINDAPVMTASDCAVSMGKLGSAAAVEASDIVLITDDLTALPRCIRAARKTRSIVKQNMAFSIVMKVAFMALGAIGILPLGLAVFADVGVMLLAVLNSLRAQRLS